MKTKISIFIAAAVLLLIGTAATFAQGTNVYFNKNGKTIFQTPISGIDSIIFITPELYAIDLRDETDIEADLCLIHKDGSYAVFYFDTDNQHYAIHVGGSIEKADLNDGYDIVLDNNGYPQVVKSKDFTIYFSNFSGNTFDAAIDYNGEVQYLWGCQSSIDFEKLLTAENQAQFLRSTKAANYIAIPQNSREWALLGATVLKVAGSAVGIVAAGSLAVTLGVPTIAVIGVLGALEIFDALNNAHVAVVTGSAALPFDPSLKDGIGIGMSLFGDSWYESINKDIDKDIQKGLEDTDYRSSQIQLSSYKIETDCRKTEESTKPQSSIEVTSKSAWEIDKATNMCDWCIAYESSNQSMKVIILEDYPSSGSRSHTFVIDCPNDPAGTKVKPVFLTVTQTGIGCTMTPDELNFEASGGSGSFTLQLDNSTNSIESVQLVGDISGNISYTPQTGLTNTATVNVNPNNDKEKKTANVVANLKVEDYRKGFIVGTISQKGTEEDFFDLSTYEMNFKKEGGTGSFTINTNLNVTNITSTRSWCRLLDNSGNPKTVNFIVEANSTTDSRTAAIGVEATDPVTGEKTNKGVVINQEGEEEPETLEDTYFANTKWNITETGSMTATIRIPGQEVQTISNPINGSSVIEFTKDGLIANMPSNIYGVQLSQKITVIDKGKIIITLTTSYSGMTISYDYTFTMDSANSTKLSGEMKGGYSDQSTSMVCDVKCTGDRIN